MPWMCLLDGDDLEPAFKVERTNPVDGKEMRMTKASHLQQEGTGPHSSRERQPQQPRNRATLAKQAAGQPYQDHVNTWGFPELCSERAGVRGGGRAGLSVSLE